MKKTKFALLIIALAALAQPFCVSCNKTPKDPQEKPEEKPEPKPEPKGPQPGTYTFTVSPLKGKWEVGDKIYVHGNYGPAAQTITLAASDISEDGRTASAKLDGVTEYPCTPDALYAAWPGEAVNPGDGLMTPTTEFSSFDSLLSVAYLSGTSFSFIDASSLFTFKAPGYTEFALAGNQRPGIRVTTFEASHSSFDTDFTGRKNDGYPYLYGTVSDDGTGSLWIPGTITLKKGYTLYLGKGGAWSACYTVSEDTKLKVGTVTDLGDISASLIEYDGPAPKMPEMKGYQRFDVKLTELSGLCLSADGTFLWGVGDGSELAKISFTGEVQNKVSLGNKYKDKEGRDRSRSLDSEGLTLNYDTGDLLIAGEAQHVFCIPADELPTVFDQSSKDCKHLFDIKEANGYGNAGMEGIAYYKNGLVYCGTQTGSDLFCCDLNATVDADRYTPVVWKKRLVEKHPTISEIGGLCYDPLTDWLWVTDSEARRITALTGDGEHILGAYSVKAVGNAESIFVDHEHGCIWVGSDNDNSVSYLFRFDFDGLDDAVIQNETN